MAGAVEVDLAEHAAKEKEYADMLADRIVTLGETPLMHPKIWLEDTRCGYEEPADEHVKDLFEQNIQGERVAIQVYQGLVEFTKDKDPVTYYLVLEILEDEIDHEEELQALQEKMKVMLK